MSIEVYKDTLKEQSDSVSKFCNNIKRDMGNLKKEISKLIDADELKGKSYTSAKNYFSAVYLPLIEAIERASESISEENKRLITKFEEEVGGISEIREEDLEEQIETAQNLISNAKYKINDDENNIDNSLLLMNNETILRKLEEKLENLRKYNQESALILMVLEIY